MSEIEMFNAHIHVFTIDHVPNQFAKGMFRPVSGLVTIRLIKRWARWIEGWEKRRRQARLKNSWFNRNVLKILLWFVQWLGRRLGIGLRLTLPGNHIKDLMARYLRLLNFSYDASSRSTYTQAHIYQRIKNYSPANTHFIALSMDMEYMGGGRPAESYDVQLEKLEELAKSDPTLHPFLCVDPRRLSKDWEVEKFFEKLESGIYKGVKLYPALGYFPFDWRILPIYLKAVELNLPIMTHCSHGPVYSRDKFKKEVHGTHPFSGMEIGKRVFKGDRIENHTVHYTDPVNYLVLVNPVYLKHYLSKVDTSSFTPAEHKLWEEHIIKDFGKSFDSEKLGELQKLKICMAHWGGGEEWDRYLEDYPPAIQNLVDPFKDDLRLAENHKKVWETYSWFTLIYEMITNPQWNFYTDLSFTLHEEKYLNVLKVQMKNEQRRKRILFGTDYYVVSHKETEREFSIDLRGALSEADWKAVSLDNPLRFLN